MRRICSQFTNQINRKVSHDFQVLSNKRIPGPGQKNMNSNVTTITSRIKRLCRLDLDGLTLAPMLLDNLQKLVPSYSNCLIRLKPDCETADNTLEDVHAAELDAWKHFDNNGCEVITGLSQNAKNELGMISLRNSYEARDNFQNGFNNEFFRHISQKHTIHVQLHEEGKAVGFLSLYRNKSCPNFNKQEQKQLDTLAPLIANAINKQTEAADEEFVDSGKSAIIITDCQQKIMNVSSDASELLHYAFHPQLCSLSGANSPRNLDHLIEKASIRLKHTGHKHKAECPPIWHRRNALGGFTFTAHGLTSAVDKSFGSIGITIHWQIPKQLKMLKRLEQYNLTNRQLDVALLMAKGYSKTKIAQIMDLSPHTVVYHCREVYGRMGVSSRIELASKLL